MEQNKIRTYLFYAVGEILVVMKNNCPVRDNLLVEMLKPTPAVRAVRYDICQATHSILNHIAYQPEVGRDLRHAVFCMHFNFYPYAVPTGQKPYRKQITVTRGVHKICGVPFFSGKSSVFTINLKQKD